PTGDDGECTGRNERRRDEHHHHREPSGHCSVHAVLLLGFANERSVRQTAPALSAVPCLGSVVLRPGRRRDRRRRGRRPDVDNLDVQFYIPGGISGVGHCTSWRLTGFIRLTGVALRKATVTVNHARPVGRRAAGRFAHLIRSDVASEATPGSGTERVATGFQASLARVASVARPAVERRTTDAGSGPTGVALGAGIAVVAGFPIVRGIRAHPGAAAGPGGGLAGARRVAHHRRAANAATRLALRLRVILRTASWRADQARATLRILVALGLRRRGSGLARAVRQRRPRAAEQEPDHQHREPRPAAGSTAGGSGARPSPHPRCAPVRSTCVLLVWRHPERDRSW